MKKPANKILQILINLIPITVMIVAIPLFRSDYVLALVFILIILFSFAVRYEKKDFVFFMSKCLV